MKEFASVKEQVKSTMGADFLQQFMVGQTTGESLQCVLPAV